MKFTLSALARDLDGRLVGGEAEVDGAAIDTRTEIDGRLFVPLVAARDGHDFVPAAQAGGAAAYLTSKPPLDGIGLPAIVVDDTGAALTGLGHLARQRLTGPVIGITGSVGKTSVKDLTLHACLAAAPTWASAGSFNNELGVPLTLANAPDGQGITIIEMGARGIGHIADLCRVAQPTIGLVTCVAMAHVEVFGTIDDVAQGKGELVEALPASGTAVLNADDPRVLAMAERTDATVMTYGSWPAGPTSSPPDVGFGPVVLDRSLRPRFTLRAGSDQAEVVLDARGAHMASNAAAALAAARAAGVGFADAVEGLSGAELSRWRMEVSETDRGALIINDAYNANPTSMRAAIQALTEVEAERRLAVIGEMAELGEAGVAEHLAVVGEAHDAGVDVIAVDAPAYGPQARHVGDLAAALAALGSLGSGDAVLIKGSRVAGLEQLANRLLGRER